MSKIFDTHCHYNLQPLLSGQPLHEQGPTLQSNWQEEWQLAQEKGVTLSVVVGSNLETSKQALSIAQQAVNLYAAVGIHPEDAAFTNQQQLQALLTVLEQLAQEKKVLAIGETGLDYFYLQRLAAEEARSAKEKQAQLFTAQIALANQLQLPLIVHLRDLPGQIQAHQDCLSLLRQHWQFQQAVIFHCSSGTLETMNEAMALDKSYFGFAGNLTFKNAENLRELFRLLQAKAPQKILLETDSPYLAPVPHRGKICQPWMIAATAEYAAASLAADLELIFANSLQAFNLKP